MKTLSWNVIGLMSGTSLDGVDLVYTQISKDSKYFNFQIVASETIPYSIFWKQKLQKAFTSKRELLNKLSIEYGVYLGDLINTFISNNSIKKVDFIASHGHTIFHKPEEGYTLQIGDGQAMSNVTKLKVVCNFRSQDVELGGQGAPLVPIGDRLFFSEYAYCLNLGGFANISYEKKGKRIAFDICPANIVLNYFAKQLGADFDENGEWASEGIINFKLLEKLNKLDFYIQKKPKSLGFEFVSETVFPLINSFNIHAKSVLRTFVAHIAYQISVNLDNNNTSKVLITGGGAFNLFLIDELAKMTKNELVIPSEQLVNFKEALIFALLGVLRLQNEVNCLRSVTGAKCNHSSGEIYIPLKFNLDNAY